MYRERAAWGVWDQGADLLPERYASAVQATGGAALLLPVGRPDTAESVLDGLAGLILTGGADIDPTHYGQSAQPHTDQPRSDRDEWEFALADAALRRGTPILGICRGLQVLNVLLGGSLVQHLPDVVGSTRHGEAAGRYNDHSVRLDPASRVGSILGPEVTAASHHHQGVDRLADSLVATGWTDDGVIEAVERPGLSWVAAVQWHPEVHDSEPLFHAFVETCAQHREAAAALVGP
jgi:putative glutamine amidotransferase